MIQTGYQHWIQNPVRAQSSSSDFGSWWALFPSDAPAIPSYTLVEDKAAAVYSAAIAGRWRVSWIDDTGELYAKHLLPNSDQFILLGHYHTEGQVEKRMEGWADKHHALVDFFPHLFICERYKAELVRLYGYECADASVVEQDPHGAYVIAVAVSHSGKFELDEKPYRHTLKEMQQMLTELRRRKLLPVSSTFTPYPALHLARFPLQPTQPA
jgi:hypothetical protein